MRIRAQKGRLYLSGSFPKKNGEPGLKQYMVTLQLTDDAYGQKQAAKLLKKAQRDLDKGLWNWDDWKINGNSIAGREHQAKQPRTWSEAIRALYRKKVTLGKCKETSWHVNYMGTLKFMPMAEVVTTKGIEEQLNKYQRDQYTYKKLFYLMKTISVLTKTDFPEVGVPLYTRAQKIEEIPDDEFIIQWVLDTPEPHRWHLGMMATYGLRPQELDECRLVEANGVLMVQVDDETKTSYRTVIPNEASWVDLFNLRERKPKPPSSRDKDRPDGTSVWINRQRLKMKIPHRPYMLRHAYAARLWREGGTELTLDVAAKLMGHSVKEHVDTYRRWIDPNQIAASAMDAIQRYKAKKIAAAEKSLSRKDSVNIDA